MRPGRSGGRWLTLLLCGAALAGGPRRLLSAPDDPPAGTVWEDLKEVHARLIHATDSVFKRQIAPGQVAYFFSPQPFDKPNGVENGLVIIVNQPLGAGNDPTADEAAAMLLAKYAAGGTVLRGYTKRGEPSEPFTTSALVYTYRRELDGAAYTAKTVCVANRATNTLCLLILKSHTDRWREIEAWGEPILASLRLDPKF